MLSLRQQEWPACIYTGNGLTGFITPNRVIQLWLSHRPLIRLYNAHIKNPACRYLLQKRRREWDTREAKDAGAGKDAGTGTASDGRRPP
jgi:hypothetical protein